MGPVNPWGPVLPASPYKNNKTAIEQEWEGGEGMCNTDTKNIAQRLFQTFTIYRDQNQLHSLRG